MRPVIIESPYDGDGCWLMRLYQRWRNRRYARECLIDSLARGEAPFASHLLYTQVLEETPEGRDAGINAGFAWGTASDATVVYEDFGISPGMRHGITEAEMCGRTVEYRRIRP